jgi:hypothetical protein
MHRQLALRIKADWHRKRSRFVLAPRGSSNGAGHKDRSIQTNATRPTGAALPLELLRRRRSEHLEHSLPDEEEIESVTTEGAPRADRSVASPIGACDAGLRPGPFPDQAASLLPGSLATTRTGLTPAGDDELVIRS